MDEELIPVHPEPTPSYTLYAVTWLSTNGEEYTRLLGATSSDEAAAIVGRLDHTIRHGTPHASVDVRECSPVVTYRSKVVVER